ncbi:hypothetical protein [Granulicella sp. dw_53]|uniref:hypothetical protein n=1 Tax=Granulicella sp. dw_53 TaxID=2719792 RepID=UPI001BD25C63|nr:hypothetical protein [Granulicella sp. dw_53]
MQTAKMSVLPDPSIFQSIHRLELEHGLYARRLDTLNCKPYLTETEKLEEIRLKKLKLYLKDEMERLRRVGFGPSRIS